MILDGLNVLWFLGVELYNIFKFYNENKKWNLIKKYIIKSAINISIV